MTPSKVSSPKRGLDEKELAVVDALRGQHVHGCHIHEGCSSGTEQKAGSVRLCRHTEQIFLPGI